MTADEIKAEIAAGRIGAITLDTSAFGKPSEMSLEHGFPARLRQFRGTSVQFVLSDIVVNEVKSHLKKGASEALSQLDKSLKSIGGSWNVPREMRAAAKSLLIGEESVDDLTSRRVGNFIDSTECTIVKAEEHATICELVRRYFANTAPFADKETKKNEFPDALALLSLDAWAKTEGAKVLVVTNDDDWVRYCDESDSLIVVRNLADALGYFNADADFFSSTLSRILNSGKRQDWQDSIESAVQSHIDAMLFMPEADSIFHFEDEITDVIVKRISIDYDGNGLSPVDKSEGFLVAKVKVAAEVDITCDFSFSIRDSIDKDYVYMGALSKTQSETVELNMLITFVGSAPDDADIDEIEIEGNRQYVAVIPPILAIARSRDV